MTMQKFKKIKNFSAWIYSQNLTTTNYNNTTKPDSPTQFESPARPMLTSDWLMEICGQYPTHYTQTRCPSVRSFISSSCECFALLVMSHPSEIFSQFSLVPIAKIASAPTRLQRIVWAIISAAMFFGLCSCITLVIIQYCKHQTVFQLDYSGRHIVYDQLPGITVCPDPQEVRRLFDHAGKTHGWPEPKLPVPWEDPVITAELLKLITAIPEMDPPGAVGHHLPLGRLTWDTENVAKSPIYRALHNFSVSFTIKPANIEQNYQLFVLEQVSNCTAFWLFFYLPNIFNFNKYNIAFEVFRL